MFHCLYDKIAHYNPGDNVRWNKFVQRQMLRWKSIIENWLIFNPENPVIVIQYEVLKEQVNSQVERILKFLNVEYDKNKLDRNLKDGFNFFKRNKECANFEHFTANQKKYIIGVIKDVRNMLMAHKKSHILSVDQYLQHNN